MDGRGAEEAVNLFGGERFRAGLGAVQTQRLLRWLAEGRSETDGPVNEVVVGRVLEQTADALDHGPQASVPQALRQLLAKASEVVGAEVGDEARLAEGRHDFIGGSPVAFKRPRRQFAVVHRGLLGVQEGVGRVLDGQGLGVGRGVRLACRASFCSRYFARAPSGAFHGPK